MERETSVIPMQPYVNLALELACLESLELAAARSVVAYSPGASGEPLWIDDEYEKEHGDAKS